MDGPIAVIYQMGIGAFTVLTFTVLKGKNMRWDEGSTYNV